MEHKKLISYLPGFLQEYYEYRKIFEAVQTEADRIGFRIEKLFNNNFVESTDEEGIAHYEEIYRVLPQEGATLEDRRFSVLSAMNIELPYTYRRLEQMLTLLCGVNGFEIHLDHNAYSIEIKVALTAKNNRRKISELMYNFLPANLVYGVTIIYNQHQTLAGYTHADLSAFTQLGVREEVLP